VTSTPISLRSIVFDCPDPSAPVSFYPDLLSGRLDVSDPEWCEVHVSGSAFKLAFQQRRLSTLRPVGTSRPYGQVTTLNPLGGTLEP
jgi:hypothetical protein